MISVQELKEAMKSSDTMFTEKMIEEMFSNIDYKGNNKLNYTEFIAASLSVK